MGEEASNEREAGESRYHCASGTSAVPLTETGVKLYKENRAFVFLCCGSAEHELMAVSGANCKRSQSLRKEKEITLWRCE